MSKPVTQVATTDLSEMLDPGTEPRMELPGFDAEFVDFPDYIIRITDRIWHERRVEMCRDYYADDCIVHTQAGTIVGVQPVIDGTRATMASFPDRRLEADNVIWSEDPPQDGSSNPVFYSSHLITSKMTNMGESEFGPATQAKVRVLTIADCACRDNVIFEEWLVRDYAAIVGQLGLDVQASAEKFAVRDRAMGVDILGQHSENFERVRRGEAVDGGRSEWSGWAREHFANVWEGRHAEALKNHYDFRVGSRLPYGRDGYGPEDIEEVVGPLLAALPDARITVDHVADIPYLGEARDVAVRWALAGHHTEDGWFGKASGLPVFIHGISQFRIINGRIREEVTLWDDFAVRRMIEGARK